MRTIKLEEGKELPPFEPQLGPNVAAEGGVVGRKILVFPGSSMPEASEPISERAINLTSAECKRIIIGLRKPDIILGSAFDKLRTLLNMIRAPDFDPVADPDTLSKI